MTTAPALRPLLTARQERFCVEYCVDLNGTQAAIRAGYSERTAVFQAARLLTNVNIQQRIAKLTKPKLEELEVTSANVLQEAARLAFSDARNVMEWGPWGARVRESSELSEDAARSVSSVKVKRKRLLSGGDEPLEWEIEDMEIKLWPKVPALDLLAKHLRLLPAAGLNVYDQRQQSLTVVAGVDGAMDGLSPDELREFLRRLS